MANDCFIDMDEDSFQDLFEEWPSSDTIVAESLRSGESVHEKLSHTLGASKQSTDAYPTEKNERHLGHETTSLGATINIVSTHHLEHDTLKHPDLPSDMPSFSGSSIRGFNGNVLEPDSSSQSSRESVITKIESIIASIIAGLLNDEPVVVPIKTRAQIHTSTSTRPGKRQVAAPHSRFAYPGSNAREAWRFS